MNTTDRNRKNRRPAHCAPDRGGSFLPAFCGFLGTVVILLVILLLLPMAVPGLLGYEAFHVVSASMAPEIPQGSMVLVRPVSAMEIRSGDVIAFEREGTVVTHRVLTVNSAEMEFVTKGDANPDADFVPVPFASLIGRVERQIPVLGALSAPISGQHGKLTMLAALTGGVLLRMLGSRMRTDRTDQEEKGRTYGRHEKK